MALGAENLNVQAPYPWIMASSAGVFCALAIMVCRLLVLRRASLTPAIQTPQVDEADYRRVGT
ncbi:hypothetical protein QK292_00030 [Arthrobacter sp. AL08]|uniref:hypothetical protein n=1 Tax=Micrococcaceae TaxID=1268 RepID=UPI00249A6610|nr:MULTISPECIES: hypothetical protein [Micrococcaceae]MDI3239951.1 hypothetical protein [Arthrobacter sp. AL05]MDI3275961.1 hypothetical protein [Arthrobacter sp. AL08]MDJ0352712.1 hypothetical protein [Pseudarthrobacter sp. PH31-O2]